MDNRDTRDLCELVLREAEGTAHWWRTARKLAERILKALDEEQAKQRAEQAIGRAPSRHPLHGLAMAMRGEGELEPGLYSAFVIMENGWWEQPTYRVPKGWTESELARAIAADPEHRFDVLFVVRIAPDPECQEEHARGLTERTT